MFRITIAKFHVVLEVSNVVITNGYFIGDNDAGVKPIDAGY
jgi:hypothetical protein